MLNSLILVGRLTKDIDIKADSICVHGDGEKALEFVKEIRRNLKEQGIDIETF